MHDRIHPIGAYRGDVTYAQFYDFFNCLEVSPCFGWMNSNATWRNLTSERAFELNVVYNEVFSDSLGLLWSTFNHLSLFLFFVDRQEQYLQALWHDLFRLPIVRYNRDKELFLSEN